MMRQLSIILLLSFLAVSCSSDKGEFIVQAANQYDTIDGKKQVISQIIKTLRRSDSLPIAILTKVPYYNNDVQQKDLTELSIEDILQNFMLDSIFYDKFRNDTLKKCFVNLDKIWHPTQTFHKTFRTDKQISYFMTERPFKKGFYFKKEIFYTYNTKGNILTETEVECWQKTDCDSTLKTKYVYNSTGNLDSTIYYIWKKNEWTEFKKKNGR